MKSLQDLKDVNNLSEVDLFISISTLSNYILEYEKNVAFGISRGIDTTKDKKTLEHLISQTEKYGVKLERDVNGKIKLTTDYSAWYEYYLEHFTRKLSKEQFKKFISSRQKGENVKEYLPSMSYSEYKKSISETQKIHINRRNVG